MIIAFTVKVVFEPDGTFRALYDDEAVEVLREIGPVTIRRASHVEPDAGGLWHADLRVSGGPVLGPFTRRRAALEAEAAWLLANGLPPGPGA